MYEELKEEMKEYCTYVSIYNYNVNNKIERIYFCGENMEKMQEIIEEYIEKMILKYSFILKQAN